MAEQGASFAGFSSGVPATNQTGQGLAQVFQPQAIGLDTTSLQKAGQAIGQTLAKKAEENARAKAAKAQADAKAKAARDKKINDRKSGIYTPNQEAINSGLDNIQSKYLSGEISEGEYDQLLNQYLKNAEAINSYETTMIAPQMKKILENENTKIYKDGQWEGAAEGTEDWSNPLDETAQELISEDPTMGLYMAYMQDKWSNTLGNVGQEDPEFDLQNAALNEKALTTFLAQAPENVTAKIGSYSDDYDLETIVKQDADVREAYKDYLKQDGALMGKWIKQQKFREGLPNDYINNLFNNEDYKPALEATQEVYAEKIDELILPSPKRSISKSFKTSSKDGSGDKAEFNAVVTQDQGKHVFSFMETWKDATGEELNKDLATAKFRQELKKNGVDFTNLNHVRLRSTKAGQQLKPISFKGKEGVVRDIFVDSDGKGILILDTDVKETTSEGTTTGGGVRTSTSKTVKEPEIIKLEPKDTKYLQELYQVEFGAKKNEEKTATKTYKGLDEDGNPIFE